MLERPMEAASKCAKNHFKRFPQLLVRIFFLSHKAFGIPAKFNQRVADCDVIENLTIFATELDRNIYKNLGGPHAKSQGKTVVYD